MRKHVKADQPLSLIEKRTFAKMPIAERRRMLKRQAAAVAERYNAEIKNDQVGGGDFNFDKEVIHMPAKGTGKGSAKGTSKTAAKAA